MVMEITETLTQDLHREFKIVVGSGDLDEKLTGRISEMQPRLNLKGFRPGKVPISFLKKTYGKSLMGEIVNKVVNECSEQALKDRSLTPATAPRVDLLSELETVVDGKADLEFTVKVDLMPEFEIGNLSELEAERLVAEVAPEDVETSLKRLADSQRVFNDKGKDAISEMGDAVTIDFIGKINGEEFEGGKSENFELTLGSGSFIPGFEEQLIGVKAGGARSVKVTFPEDYGRVEIAGKEAEFAVDVKAVKSAEQVPLDDKLAQAVGMESLAALTEAVRKQLEGEYAGASRTHLKRRILDALDAAYDFALPPGMVDTEFDAIWRQLESEFEKEGKTEEEQAQSEEELKEEYRAIAARRVRLGLILAKIGEQNGLDVGQEELNRAVAARARRYPGQEQKIYEFIANNPQALAEVRVPLFEDKVIDFISELISVKNRSVDPETLFLDPDAAAEKLGGAEDKAKTKAKKSGSKPKAKTKAKTSKTKGD
jgi:trigger factor